MSEKKRAHTPQTRAGLMGLGTMDAPYQPTDQTMAATRAVHLKTMRARAQAEAFEAAKKGKR